MKKKLISIFLFILSTSSLAKTDLLFKYCNEYNGTVFKSYKCPKSKLLLPVNTCEFKNKQGVKQFFNGCSGPSGGHNEIFFSACIQHDLCYHHEPVSNGLGQSYCDFQFFEGMLKACDENALNIPRCKKWAKIMYRGVRIIGKPAFHCANYPAKY